MTSIFVAKLDFGVTGEQLKSTFEEYGKVLKASVAIDRETGKSRGFGFVEMADRDEAQNAISALDASLLNGRIISVKEAEQRENRPTTNGSKPGFSSGERKPFKNPEINDTEAVIPILTPEKFIKSTPFTKSDRNKNEPKKKKNSSMQAYKKSGKTPRYDLYDDNFDLDDWKPNKGKKTNYRFDDTDDL